MSVKFFSTVSIVFFPVDFNQFKSFCNDRHYWLPANFQQSICKDVHLDCDPKYIISDTRTFTTRRVSFPENVMFTLWVVALHTLQNNSAVL